VNPEGREIHKIIKSVLDGSKKLETFITAAVLNDKAIAEMIPADNSSKMKNLKIDSYLLTITGIKTLLERLSHLSTLFCRASLQEREIKAVGNELRHTDIKDYCFKRNSGSLPMQELVEFLGHSGF
jgi:hypothetical protein